MPDMEFLSVLDIAQRVRNGQLSPVAYVEHLLLRIESLDPQLKAFSHVMPDAARLDAQAAEAALQQGKPIGLLHGVPVAVKDNIDVTGVPTLCGSRALAGAPPASRDAAIVTRLRQAGAIIIGKLALEEFAIGDQAQDEQTRNPWDPSRTAGGSSTGAGVAVAAGLVPAAIGTDTGGSVRNPAALCGVVGMKPSFGWFPLDGVFPLAPSLDHAGIITRTVADNAYVFQALTGRTAAAALDIGRLRIGIVRHLYRRDLPSAPEMIGAIEAAAATFQRLGASVQDIEIDPLEAYRACGGVILAKESFDIHAALLETEAEHYHPLSRRLLLGGRSITRDAYEGAQRQRAKAQSDLAAKMQHLDLLITGVTPTSPCRLDDLAALEASGNGAMRLPFNVTGNPAIALPIGFSSEGLPLSLQMIGKPSAENVVFNAALAYERATMWSAYRPTLDWAR